MLFLDTILAWAGFGFACMAILVAPWFFGSWEMWWFWPFTVCIFISTFFFSVRLLLSAGLRKTRADTLGSSTIIVLTFLPFLIYAFVRFMQADVFMDAERSFLLFLTPFLLGIQIVFGFSSKQIKLLFLLFLMDLLLLGLYGIINHSVTGGRLVLWAEAYEQYSIDNRASGSYFCPNHFSGIMELAFCMGLGLLLARETGRNRKVFAVLLMVVALWAIMLTKSRGGALTIIAITAGALIWGFSQWPQYVRWCWRAVVGSLLVLSVILFCFLSNEFLARFKDYIGWYELKNKTFREKTDFISQRVRVSSRGCMIGGSIQAWKTAPIFGIGPGMHQNLWPHFAASPDGDRELGIWPTLLNNDFHSYEVHSDWVQLLEEYGIVGLILFLIPASAVFAIVLTGLRREERERMQNNWRETGREHNAVVLSGIFAYVCMAFHSIGDFNLQMPATVWLFAAILAMPLAHIVSEDQRSRRMSTKVCS